MPKKIPKKYNIAALHTGGKDRCNNVAFYYEGPIVAWNEVVESKKAIFPSGEKPNPGAVIKCGACGFIFPFDQLLDAISLWVSEEEYNVKT